MQTSPGPSATAPECAQVLANLPDRVGAAERREVTAQATAAWADPDDQVIRLRCGTEPTGPSTDPCTSVADVDWVVTQSADEVLYRSYGRLPAVEITLPVAAQDGTDLLLGSVSASMAPWPVERECS